MFKSCSKFSMRDRRKILSGLLWDDCMFAFDGRCVFASVLQWAFPFSWKSQADVRHGRVPAEVVHKSFSRKMPKLLLYIIILQTPQIKCLLQEKRSYPSTARRKYTKFLFLISRQCMELQLRLQQKHIFLEHGRYFPSISNLEKLHVSRFVQPVTIVILSRFVCKEKMGDWRHPLRKKAQVEAVAQDGSSNLPRKNRHAKSDNCLRFYNWRPGSICDWPFPLHHDH